MKLSSLLVIVCVVGYASTAHECRGFQPNDYLQTGTIEFQNQDHFELECYEVVIKYQIPIHGVQIAVSTSDLGYYRPKTGLDYSVRGSRKDGSNSVTFSLFIAPQGWKQITASYLVSSRHDLKIGTFIVDTHSIFGCNKKTINQAPIQQFVGKFDRPYPKFQLYLFVSGLKTEDQTVHLNLLSGKFDEYGLISFNIKEIASPAVNNVHITYVIVAGSAFSVNLFNPQKGSSADYIFTGIQRFKRSSPVYKGLAIGFDRLDCVGKRCPGNCINSDECKELKGEIYENTCYLCKKDQKIQGGKCVPRCGQNEIYFFGRCKCKKGYQQINGECVKDCEENEIYQNGKCVCKNGYARIYDKCTKCPKNSAPAPDQSKCICESGFQWENGECVKIECPKNSEFVYKDNYYKCQCFPGYVMFGSECKSICGINEEFYHDKCRCIDGHAKIDGVCRKCPLYSEPNVDRTECLCDNNYHWNSQRRTCDYIKCPQNSKPVLSDKKYKCECVEGYILYKNKCYLDPHCGVNQIFIGSCVCKIPYVRIDGKCQSCPKNSAPAKDYSKCVCDKGYVWNQITHTCHQLVCPPNSEPAYVDGKLTCKCDPNYYLYDGKCFKKPDCGPNEVAVGKICECVIPYVRIDGKCQKCPVYSSPSKDYTECVCDHPYKWNYKTYRCERVKCGPNSSPVYIKGGYKCECDSGYIENNGQCEARIKCPPRSFWNPNTLQCECKYPDEHLIGKQCKKCEQNEGWNGDECVCKTGYHKIDGKCRTCDPNSSYNGVDCICNHGFYGNRDKCSKCHETCGQCSGPKDNQCITCTDISYDLVDGKCTRNIPCPTGLYLDGRQCRQCSAYCAKCQSDTICDRCMDGFKLQSTELFGMKTSYCTEICGDGRRFQVDCDDGNLKNGDGCNENCEVEDGYTCQGGSSIKPSHCVSFAPSRTFITLTGSVHLFGKVVQGIRMSYIPTALTENQCAKCSKLLWVRVIDSQIVPGVRVKYLPKSKYQFLVEFEFHGLFAIPIFKIGVQINPEFSKYFNEADLAQIKIKTIDPAVLAKVDLAQTLSLDEDPQEIKTSPDMLHKIFD